jgi:hypothetical protein
MKKNNGYPSKIILGTLIVTTTGRLRFIGCALGPINSDERALLICTFEVIEKRLGKGKVTEIIESLTLDRGY